MKRSLARLGLFGILVGAPIALRLLIGSPVIPTFEGSDGLSGSYVPFDAVLGVLGLLMGSLGYLTLAVLLHSLAIVTASFNAPGHRALFAASTILTPKVVRALVELAIGSALVTASVSIHASSALPAVSHPSFTTPAPPIPTSCSSTAQRSGSPNGRPIGCDRATHCGGSPSGSSVLASGGARSID